MTSVVMSHAVGNMDTWLGGGESRKKVFGNFCSGHRIFKHVEADRVTIVCENVDMSKMQATIDDPETDKAKAAHTVIEPIDVYIEVEGSQ
jgi:hypothetical protein